MHVITIWDYGSPYGGGYGGSPYGGGYGGYGGYGGITVAVMKWIIPAPKYLPIK
jgi:hypothetical protein